MSKENIVIAVSKDDLSGRLDSLISGKVGVTRARLKKMFDEGWVKVNGRPAKASYKVKAGDEISFPSLSPEKAHEELMPEDLPINILYRDDDLVVVDKPAGMVVYPAAGHPTGTLVNALKFLIKDLCPIGAPLRPGVVHRLDRDTSGVMVVALSEKAYYGLVDQFRKRTIGRNYLAVVFGRLKENRGEIALGIGRSESDRKKMSTKSKRAKEAKTAWEAVEKFSNATLVKASLATGRTHQIRVHFSATGHPVLGDRTYGNKLTLIIADKKDLKRSMTFPRQMLHAETLGFTHPVTGERLEFSSPLPEDMKRAIEELRPI